MLTYDWTKNGEQVMTSPIFCGIDSISVMKGVFRYPTLPSLSIAHRRAVLSLSHPKQPTTNSHHSLTGCGGSNTLAVSFSDARANRSSHARFDCPQAGVLANYGLANYGAATI